MHFALRPPSPRSQRQARMEREGIIAKLQNDADSDDERYFLAADASAVVFENPAGGASAGVVWCMKRFSIIHRLLNYYYV